MTVVVDAMGGDNAPVDIIEGVRLYIQEESDTDLILVGDREQLDSLCSDLAVPIVESASVVGMHESPSVALKTKRDSSIAVAMGLMKKGKADALISMGNSGATVGFALFVMGRLGTISRPAIVAPIPVLDKYTLLLDVGATVDCKPEQLLDFAVMGSVYSRQMFGHEKPTVGILSIGEEPGKGNEQAVATAKLLEDAPINFIGNVEGGDVMTGKVDVIVCDGFVGNIILKFGEGLVEMFSRAMKVEAELVLGSDVDTDHRVEFFKETLKQVDYTSYGGATLLGIDGHCLIGHGRSGPRAIANGIRAARNEAVKCPVVNIREALELVHQND